MTISRKQFVVLAAGSLLLLAVIGLMMLTQRTVPVQAAEQENPVSTENTGALSGGNDCYCAYPRSVVATPTPAIADPP